MMFADEDAVVKEIANFSLCELFSLILDLAEGFCVCV